MNIGAHLDKIARLEALRARLDPLDDFELWFWAAMNAGTHAVNIMLHRYGLTRDDDVFPTQPGVYLVPQNDGGLQPQYHPLGDILHVGRPKVEGVVPPELADMMAAMEIIEHHRDPSTRGDQQPTQAIVDECETALKRCFSHLQIGAAAT